ncbi:BLUF domain-containing protein [Sphingomonas profundi]|uniref:BLUF domain-containing protein n=1 Tax=Alterirhizorhabdus profundi TaxID=2681549 RepID=UPI0012E81E55|nr:BLUF domain-containing protein [Sphingomonas profundi]
MSDEIYRLVYYSRNLTTTGQDRFAAEVDNILDVSRANNARDGITGALMFNAGCFAQVLEGPLGMVEAAFERIQQDERHGEVSLLAFEPIAARSFPNWAMGFVGLADEDAVRFADVASASDFDPSRFSGDKLHTILRDLAIDEERAAA